MKTNYEIIQEINTISKNYYKSDALSLAFAWGCAQALLTTEQLEIILRIAKEQENN